VRDDVGPNTATRLSYSELSMLQKKLPVVLMFLLFADLVLLAGYSNDSSSVGPSTSAPQTGPEGPTNTIGGIG
jgi:hypothetical protein